MMGANSRAKADERITAKGSTDESRIVRPPQGT